MNAKLSLIAAAAAAAFAAPLVLAGGQSGEHFIKESIQGNLGEVKAGDLAQRKGASEGVKEFGVTLAKDHAAANDKANQAAQSMGVTPPTEPGTKQNAMYEELSRMSGEQFDQHFIEGMLKDHKEDIAKYEKEANSGSGPAASYAKEILPHLRKHLQIAERLQQQQRTASVESSKMK
jgi:putative membrane protein